MDGYHGVELAEEDRHKTTFITKDGKYRYKRIPQGYGSSGDGYVRRAETHFFFIYFLAGSESRYFTQINNFRYLRKSLKSLQRAHFLTFGCDTKYTTFSKTPEKNNSEFLTILKRLFLISIKELREN